MMVIGGDATDLYKLLDCAVRRWNAARDSDVLSTLLCSKCQLQIKKLDNTIAIWGRRRCAAIYPTLVYISTK